MNKELPNKTIEAVQVERDLVSCYTRILKKTDNPQVKAIIRDLILMEEMNEVLLRSLSYHLG